MECLWKVKGRASEKQQSFRAGIGKKQSAPFYKLSFSREILKITYKIVTFYAGNKQRAVFFPFSDELCLTLVGNSSSSSTKQLKSPNLLQDFHSPVIFSSNFSMK